MPSGRTNTWRSGSTRVISASLYLENGSMHRRQQQHVVVSMDANVLLELLELNSISTLCTLEEKRVEFHTRNSLAVLMQWLASYAGETRRCNIERIKKHHHYPHLFQRMDAAASSLPSRFSGSSRYLSRDHCPHFKDEARPLLEMSRQGRSPLQHL